MLNIYGLKSFFAPFFQQGLRSRKTLGLGLVFVGSAWIATQMTSDYRFRVAIILGTGILSALALKLHKIVQRYFYIPPVRTFKTPYESGSYLDLLGADAMKLLALYLSGDEKSQKEILLDEMPESSWQKELIANYVQPFMEISEEDAQKNLRKLRIPYHSEFEISTHEFLYRHQRLRGGNHPIFQRKSLNLRGSFVQVEGGLRQFVYGPILVVHDRNDAERYTAINWITQKRLWEKRITGQPTPISGTPYIKFYDQVLDVRTGNTLSGTFENLFCTENYCVEKRDPLTLYVHGLDREITLEKECAIVAFLNDSCLGFLDGLGNLWVKKGDQKEELTAVNIGSDLDIEKNMRCFYPYIVTSNGIYSLETGQQIYMFGLPVNVNEVGIYQDQDNKNCMSYSFFPLNFLKVRKTVCIDDVRSSRWADERDISHEQRMTQEGSLFCYSTPRSSKISFNHGRDWITPHSFKNLGGITEISIYNSYILAHTIDRFYRIDLLAQG